MAIDPPWRLDPFQNIVSVGWVGGTFDVSAGMVNIIPVTVPIRVECDNGMGVLFDGIQDIPAEEFDFGFKNASNVAFFGEGAYMAGGSCQFKLSKFDLPLVITLRAFNISSGGSERNLVVNNRGMVDPTLGIPVNTQNVTIILTAFSDGHSTMTASPS